MLATALAHYFAGLSTAMTALIWHVLILKTFRHSEAIRKEDLQRLHSYLPLGLCVAAAVLCWPGFAPWLQHAAAIASCLIFLGYGFSTRFEPDSFWAQSRNRITMSMLAVGFVTLALSSPIADIYAVAFFSLCILGRSHARLLKHLQQQLADLEPLRSKIQSLSANLHQASRFPGQIAPSSTQDQQAG